MGKVVCIACVKSKRPQRSRVEDLYTSSLFKFSLRYARSLKPDHIFVLSAKHGVLQLSKEVDPYEQTLKNMRKRERLAWAERALDQLRQCVDLDQDEFVFLAGMASLGCWAMRGGATARGHCRAIVGLAP